MKTKRDKIAFSLILVFLLSGLAFAQGDHPTPKEFAYESLSRVILHSYEMRLKRLKGQEEQGIADPGGLILLLAEIDDEEARNVLLKLSEINIGAATGEALAYAIVTQGKSIRDDLEGLLSRPVECELLKQFEDMKFENLRCIPKESRDRIIKQWIELIDKEVKIEYVY